MKCLFFEKFKYYTSNIAWFQFFGSPALYDIVFFHNFSFKLCIMYNTFYFKCLIRFFLSVFSATIGIKWLECVSFTPSAIAHFHYKGNWNKLCYTSPFNIAQTTQHFHQIMAGNRIDIYKTRLTTFTSRPHGRKVRKLRKSITAVERATR
jgi:hypothetical protein